MASVVVTRIMANVPTSEFQKLWSNLTEYLRFEYESTIHLPKYGGHQEKSPPPSARKAVVQA
jgi:hypothetical protein